MLVRVPFKVAEVGTLERQKHDLFALTHRHYWQSEFLALERHLIGSRYAEYAVWDGRHLHLGAHSRLGRAFRGSDYDRVEITATSVIDAGWTIAAQEWSAEVEQ